MSTSHAHAPLSGATVAETVFSGTTETLVVRSSKYKKPDLVTSRSVLFVGPSGSGKSQVINSIAARSINAAGMSVKPVTMEHMTFSQGFLFQKGDQQFTINCYDTRGFMDSHFAFLELVDDWNKMVRQSLNEVHFVVFVLPIDRYSKSIVHELTQMVKHLKDWGMQDENIIVLLNKRDLWRDDIVERYGAEFREAAFLPQGIRSASIIPTCFMSLDEVAPQYIDLISEKVEFSRELLLDKLTSDEPIREFHPRKMVLEEDERKLLEALKTLKSTVDDRCPPRCTIC